MQDQPDTRKVQRNTMKRKTFIITVEHDDSLYPDEGALLSQIEAALLTRHTWFRNLPTILTIEVDEDTTLADHDVLDAEWHEAFDALNAADVRHDADDPIAARYRAASGALNHFNRQHERGGR